MLRLLICLGLLLSTFVAMAQSNAPLVDVPPGQEARYQALIAQLRCVICQNRTIAESDAPLAADMRQLVAKQMRAGQSDEQIKDFLVVRYGEFVLYNPRFNAATWLLWIGPPLLLIIGLIVVFLLWRRSAARNEPAAPDTQEIQKLLEEGRHSK